jgi:ferredoxin
MAYQINLGCIVCGKCARHCPVEAIELGYDIYEINPKQCVSCKGYHSEPQCVAVCPVDVVTKVRKRDKKKN